MKRIIVILINVFFLLPISISATTKATPCEFSEAYLEWLNLTSIEQSIIPMPTICKNDEPFQQYYQNQNLFNYSVKATYPSKYDSRNVDGKNYVSPVRNQMSTGACWAFSALATVESYSMKYFNNNTIYSPRHIDYSTSRYFLNNVTNPESFNRTVGQGGNGYMASSYLINGKGPITENQMPFENNENLININSIKNKTVNLDVNGYEIIENSSLGCSTTIKNKIKEHIMQYGSMAASIYMTTNSSYYRASSHALNYNSTSAQDFYAPNHAITIIGWDDNFSRNLFAAGHQPSSNGAWIVKNSYGTNWSYGDNGYFYISYEDDWVCQNPTGATSIDQEVEDKIYYHDVLGYNSYYGYNDSQAAAVNIFELETSQELLEEVTFVAKENTNYVIYLNPQDDDLNLNKFIKIGSGKTTYAGYHTYKLSKPYLLENKKFAIMVSYDLEDGTHPIGTQIVSGTFFDKGNTTPELSYVSSSINGPWEDLSDETRYQPFASIKGSTNQINYNFQISQPQITPDYPYTNGEFNITIPFTSTNVELDSLQINILNSQNKNVTNDFNVVKASNKITISSKGSSLLSDDYEVSINYQEITRTMSFHLYEQFEIYPQDIVTNTNMYDTNENNIDIPVNTVGYEDNYELEIIVKNSSGNDVTKELNITNNTIINNKAKIHIVIPEDTLHLQASVSSPSYSIGSDMANESWALRPYKTGDTLYRPVYDLAHCAKEVEIGAEDIAVPLERAVAAIQVILNAPSGGTLHTDIDTIFAYIGDIANEINFITAEPTDFSKTIGFSLSMAADRQSASSFIMKTFPSAPNPLFTLRVYLKNGEVKEYSQRLSNQLLANSKISLTLEGNVIFSETTSSSGFQINNWQEENEQIDLPPLE